MNTTFYNQLIKFISQTDTNDLKSLLYKKEFLDFKVKISFGQGQKARVPWIAFLSEGRKVRKSIYPVFLFFKSKNILILGVGMGDSKRIEQLLSHKSLMKIDDFFNENNLGEPERYGNSYLFKTYNPDKLTQSDLDKDLLELINIYKTITSK